LYPIKKIGFMPADAGRQTLSGFIEKAIRDWILMERNLIEKFEKAALEHLNKTAIQHKKRGRWLDISYGGFRNSVRSLSAFLLEEGIEKEEKVAVLMENRPEWPLVFFSTLCAGAVSIPVNPGCTPEEIENILKDSECKFVFVSEDSFVLADEVCRRCPSIKKVISVDSDAFKDAVKKTSERRGEAEVGGHDLACILYTSGTTGEPKGVMLSHGNLLSNCDSMRRLNLLTQKDNIVSILPLHHAYPLTATMIFPLLYGGRIVYPGTMRGSALLEAVREAGATVFIAVPQIFYSFHQKITDALKKIPFPFNLLLKFAVGFSYKIRKKTGLNLPRYLLYGVHRKFGRSMRLFVSGGAKLDENVERDLSKFGFTILEGYGLTETSPILTMNPLKKPKIGSAGLPVPDVELRIANKNEKGIGEVIARGPNIMKGYYKRADLTADVIKDGWFWTGDLGHIDEDGYLFLTGRVKEVIVLSSGMNVYPAEVEEAYSRQMPVKEMCVFEVPSKKGAEGAPELWAVVVPDLELFRKHGELNLRFVIKTGIDTVSRTLPPHMRLMGFSITLEGLPRTLLGKIKRFAVKETYAAKAAEEAYTPETKELSEEDLKMMEKDISRKITGYLEKQTGIKRAVVPADLLELDLGIDSLARIELASGLEKLVGMEIKDEIIGKAFTVRDLIAGIEPFLPAGGKALPVYEEGALFATGAPGQWKKTLQVLPRQENLEKIDLNPGRGAYLVGFLFTCLFKTFFNLFYGLKIRGTENLPDKGPYILYVNHTSYLDPFLVVAAFPRFPRLDLFFMGFRVYVDVAVVRGLIKVGRIIPLDFSTHFLEALRSCYYVLKNGRGVCLFPEGLRSPDGRIAEFKKGFGILAKETKAKLVPVLIEGAYQAWPRTSRFPGRYPVKVTIGKALDPEELEKEGLEAGAEDSYAAICTSARKALLDLQNR